MTSALAEALSILTTGGEAARRAQLDANVLTALSTAPSAQLWASLMEAIEAVNPRDRANTGFRSRICSHRVCWSRARGLSERGGLARRGALRNRKA